ncbi:hypothetical protein PMAYCL1PPCAC_20467, partial [Pristionchus mayeri]
ACLPLLLFSCLFVLSHSLKCNYTRTDGQIGICSGDLCVIRMRENVVLARGCTFGGNYDSYRGYCVKTQDATECYCSNTDFCNTIDIANSTVENNKLVLWPNKCFVGTSSECVGSTCSMSLGSREKQLCQNTIESVIYRANTDLYVYADISESDPSNPDQGTHVNGTSKNVYGNCYKEGCWNSSYTDRVKALMNKNVTTRCIVNDVTNSSCIGDYCYITRNKFNETSESFIRGCFIVDGLVISNSKSISAAGMDHYIDRTTIYCNAPDCNKNFETAWKAIGTPFAAYISSSTTSSFLISISLLISFLL